MYLYPDPAARLAYQRAHMRRQRAGEFRLAIPWEEWRAIDCDAEPAAGAAYATDR